jgi:hypothetical protein
MHSVREMLPHPPATLDASTFSVFNFDFLEGQTFKI